MRHGKTINHLGRQASHRKSLLANLACALIMHKRINTTLAKAKALRTYAEPLITKAKDDSTSSRRIVFAYLKQKDAVTELFRTIAPKIMDRPGGYLRILKTGFRQGDAAETCLIEFVDFNENYSANKNAAPKKTATRRSRSKKASTEAPAAETPATEEPKAEAPKVEAIETEALEAEAPKAEE